MKSLHFVVFPCMLAGKSTRVKTGVVPCSIPRLVGKSSMNRAEMVINLKNYSIGVFFLQKNASQYYLAESLCVVNISLSHSRIL